ncbi:unnamed protein product [Camellia sinensis]
MRETDRDRERESKGFEVLTMASSPTSSSYSTYSSPFSSSPKFSDLPIMGLRHKIIEKIQENRATLIVGETGCGKSSQVPQFLLEENMKPILCTQPRRFAVVAVARMVAKARNCEVGGEVGYHIGHSKVVSARTAFPINFLCCLLRTAIFLEAKNSCKSEIEKRIATMQRVGKTVDALGTAIVESFAAVDGGGVRRVTRRRSFGSMRVSVEEGSDLPRLHEVVGLRHRLQQRRRGIQVSQILNSAEAEAPIPGPSQLNLTVLMAKQGSKLFADLLKSSGAESIFNENLDGGLTVFCPSDSILNSFMPKYKNLTAVVGIFAGDENGAGWVLCLVFVTEIVFKTAGVLLDEMREKGLDALKYKDIILDEVHERSVESDLVLVCVKQFLLKNNDLRDYFKDLGRGERVEVLAIPSSEVILATNIAESSVTIPKVAFVIDWMKVTFQKAMDPPDPEVVEDALSLLDHINALEKTSHRGRYEPTFYGRLLASFSLSFDASMIILKFGDMGMLHEGILLGVLMDTQPLPILRPFAQDILSTALTGRKEMVFMANLCAFQLWQCVYKKY